VANYTTNLYEGMLAETVATPGAGGDVINAYFARPLGAGPFPGMVLIHHLPGWDEWYREAARKFAITAMRRSVLTSTIARGMAVLKT